jgi:hypothetical protein
MPILADDGVVKLGDADRCCDGDELLGHADIGLLGSRIARRELCGTLTSVYDLEL